jgi:hypothetical protein
MSTCQSFIPILLQMKRPIGGKVKMSSPETNFKSESLLKWTHKNNVWIKFIKLLQSVGQVGNVSLRRNLNLFQKFFRNWASQVTSGSHL